jgi:hypothetical protein
MIDIEDMDDASGFIDAVHDPVGAAPGTVTAGQRAEQRLADTLRVDSQPSSAELKDRGSDGLGQPPGDGPPRQPWALALMQTYLQAGEILRILEDPTKGDPASQGTWQVGARLGFLF